MFLRFGDHATQRRWRKHAGMMRLRLPDRQDRKIRDVGLAAELKHIAPKGLTALIGFGIKGGRDAGRADGSAPGGSVGFTDL